MTLAVQIAPLPHHAGLELPSYASAGAAGLDLRAAIPAESPVNLGPGERRLIPTGLRLAIPPGYECQVRPRSGLALKHGVTCLNSPGTVDSDYRGELGVILVNLGQQDFLVQRGERIAQLVFSACCRVHWDEVGELVATDRGERGFGSTGRG